MDLLTTRTIDVTKLALDGLMMRQKAITANTANVLSPGYQRKEINFESQLKEIVEKEDLKTMIKEKNSIEYTPNSLDVLMDRSQPNLTAQQIRFLQTDSYNNFNPQVIDDVASGSDETGNNVDLEKEVMDMANVGIKYNVLASLEQRSIKNLSDAIRGDV